MISSALRSLSAVLAVAAISMPLGSPASGQESAPLEERGYVLDDVVLGSDDAPVTVFEYYSPTCPHCASFHVNTFPRLKSEYIDTGKVRFIAREVYFDQVGLLAGRIARCGGEDQYYRLVDAILGSMDAWGRSRDAANALVETILKAGFPASRLRTCLEDREYAIHLVDQAKVHIEANEIESTPTFIIGDETIRGAIPFDEIADVIEAALP